MDLEIVSIYTPIARIPLLIGASIFQPGSEIAEAFHILLMDETAKQWIDELLTVTSREGLEAFIERNQNNGATYTYTIEQIACYGDTEELAYCIADDLLMKVYRILQAFKSGVIVYPEVILLSTHSTGTGVIKKIEPVTFDSEATLALSTQICPLP